jgi:hypothetical protein
LFEAFKRHPIPIEAFFRFSLVITYAFPENVLRPLLPPGLTLDTFEGSGFVAIALVKTEHLRPKGWPAFMGRSFVLSGYRIFSRFPRAGGTTMRGLRILRSDTDSLIMAKLGNLTTHYRYTKCDAEIGMTPSQLEITIRTPHGEADLSVTATLGTPPASPPPGSPFPDLHTARRFAGPLPFTFDHEPQTQSIVVVKGMRDHWVPTPVEVSVPCCRFLEKPPFCTVAPRLANAFLVENIPYRWERGFRLPIAEPPSEPTREAS